MFGRGEAAAMATWIAEQANLGMPLDTSIGRDGRTQYERRTLAGRMAAILVPEGAGNA